MEVDESNGGKDEVIKVNQKDIRKVGFDDEADWKSDNFVSIYNTCNRKLIYIIQ